MNWEETAEARMAEIRRLRKIVICYEQEQKDILTMANEFAKSVKEIQCTGRFAIAEDWRRVFLLLCCEHVGENLIRKLATAIDDMKKECEFITGGVK